MQMRAMGPGAGWRWLMQGVNLGRNNPKAIFGGVALLALVALVPSVIQVIAQYGLKLESQSLLMVIGFTTLLSIIVFPLLIGGMLRVIDAGEHGRPTHATAIFDAFRGGHGAGRLIGFGVLMSVIYIGVFLALVSLLGEGMLDWYLQVITASQAQQAGTPPAVPPIPKGFGRVMALGSLFGLFFGGVYAIGFGQIALTDRSVGGALADGFTGALKNLLPILVLAIIAFVALILLIIAFMLVALLLGAIGKLVHEALALVLLVPLYIGLLLAIYAVMFGVMYHLWRDVAGGDAAAGGDSNGVVAA
ncbi:hypothetical protein IP90_03199 [Luteimonas cucumeris]|uniref:Glycerophosphoryl diester phosphodiesterase family protein n=1 Tax=Luteimonas cucumeris TaxID=985012 RepID=A0A562KUL1_9GAMM|nr:hypothetical protein [Luteimonas cucumeris]TWH99108.1 hypothetical protein IP90_03199 [Luteimonas cucumeris]